MSDKPIAGLVTVAAILPLCALCVLGPVAVGTITASLASWFGELGPWVIVGAGAGGAALGYVLRRRPAWRQMRADRST